MADIQGTMAKTILVEHTRLKNPKLNPDNPNAAAVERLASRAAAKYLKVRELSRYIKQAAHAMESDPIEADGFLTNVATLEAVRAELRAHLRDLEVLVDSYLDAAKANR